MKVLKSYEFPATVGNGTHDWDMLLDGKIRQLEEGKDYSCKASTFRMMAYKQGRKRGMAVRVAAVDGGLVLQAKAATKEQLGLWASQSIARGDKAEDVDE
jgi:hypothetical protein